MKKKNLSLVIFILILILLTSSALATSPFGEQKRNNRPCPRCFDEEFFFDLPSHEQEKILSLRARHKEKKEELRQRLQERKLHLNYKGSRNLQLRKEMRQNIMILRQEMADLYSSERMEEFRRTRQHILKEK